MPKCYEDAHGGVFGAFWGSWGPPKLILPDGENWASEPRLVFDLGVVLWPVAVFGPCDHGKFFGPRAWRGFWALEPTNKKCQQEMKINPKVI